MSQEARFKYVEKAELAKIEQDLRKLEIKHQYEDFRSKLKK